MPFLCKRLLSHTQRQACENLVTTLIVGAVVANGTSNAASIANTATLEQDNNSLKLAASLGKVAYKTLKELHKAGKLTKDNLVTELKKQGTDELLDIADDLLTVFSADANALERLLAVVDLVVGSDLGKGSGKAYAIFEKKVGEIQERVGAARKVGNGADQARTVGSALDELKQLPSFTRMKQSEIAEILNEKGFRSIPANNVGTVWTKQLPD